MGSQTSHCRYEEDKVSLNCFSSSKDSVDRSPSDDHHHISKKHRVSTMHFNQDHHRPISSQSLVSRIHQYPPPTQNFSRQVHAPCRKPKFFSSNSGRVFTHSNDDQYGWKSYLFRTLHHFKKDKEIIDLEPEASSKDTSSRDSTVVEEIHNLISDDDSSVVEEIEILSDGEDALVQGSYANVTSYGYPASSSNRGLKVEDVGKMLESMSVHNGVEDLGLPEKQNYIWNDLAFDINLNVEKLSLASKPAKKPEKEIFRELFSLLTEEEEDDLSAAFSSLNRKKILVTHQASNIEITGQVLLCLRPGGWLNDEVINLYFELLKEREEREPNKFLKCHFFNTFFYRKLISGSDRYDFKAIRRWTTQRKIGYGLIECDKIFVPIHKQTHWCLAVINRKDKKFQYLDSLKGMDTQVLEVLARYYVDEVKDKSAQDIDVSSWEHEYVDDLPEQKNGFDCGMFLLKYTDFYSRDLTLFFGQKHMPYFRRRTAKEILKLKAE